MSPSNLEKIADQKQIYSPIGNSRDSKPLIAGIAILSIFAYSYAPLIKDAIKEYGSIPISVLKVTYQP